MTTIIATIKPCWLDKIRGGIKLEEVRKTIPGRDFPVKVLCCASGTGGQILCEFTMFGYHADTLNGIRTKNPSIRDEDPIRQSQVSWRALKSYMKDQDIQPIFFWQISNLIDYESTDGYRVRNISEFGLKRPPQSWQYIDA